MIRRWKVAPAVLVGMLFSPAISAAVGDFKTGTYSVAVSGINWSISFDDGGGLTLRRNGSVMVEGRYKVSGDHIEISDGDGPMACGGGAGTGRYRWKLEGDRLTLTKVNDACEGRGAFLTARPWVRE